MTKPEQKRLRDLFAKEVRKGAFVPQAGPIEAVRAAFCHHVAQEFDGTELHVVDFMPMLRRRARLAAKARTPLTALLLYATWVEHWLNMFITVGRLRNGQSVAQIESYFGQQPRSDAKVAEVETALGFGSLPKRDEVIRLVKLRNDVVHYEWSGLTRSALNRFLGNIRNVARRGETIVSTLSSFERDRLDAPARELGSRLFPKAG